MNVIEIYGRIGKDGIQAHEKNGKPYFTFSVASDRSSKKDAPTDWFRCVSFKTDTETLPQGTFVKVRGQVVLGEYDGKKTLEVIVTSVAPYEAKKGEEAAA